MKNFGVLRSARKQSKPLNFTSYGQKTRNDNTEKMSENVQPHTGQCVVERCKSFKTLKIVQGFVTR